MGNKKYPLGYYKGEIAMKKIVALLLALSMLFALCACSNKSQTESNKDKVTISVEEQKAEDALIAVEDCKIHFTQDGRFCLHAKVRNICDEDIGMIKVNYQLLDKNGDSLRNWHMTLDNIMVGQAMWSGHFTIGEVAFEDLGGIAFVNASPTNSTDIMPIKEKVTFAIEDIPVE